MRGHAHWLVYRGRFLGLKTITAYPQLPNKALGSIILLLTTLLVALFCLAPGQPVAVVGGEVLGTGPLGWGSTSRLALKGLRVIDLAYQRSQWLNVASIQLAGDASLSGAGVALLAVGSAGLYGVLFAIACSFFKASLDAWILLVGDTPLTVPSAYRRIISIDTRASLDGRHSALCYRSPRQFECGFLTSIR